ncbi:MAG TPA: 2OG-Fe(II) oxygenase [Candidatus Binataceae bacterium]|nr:2OG-Fe(II) oxygenase [Candidatus Binataceae bacterium]
METNTTAPIIDRVAALDWPSLTTSLDTSGYALTPAILTPAECAHLAGLYDIRDHFRSRVNMARFGYGLGEYKYFGNPLPDVVAQLRAAVYPYLAPLANRWLSALRFETRFPPVLGEFLEVCHRHGQARPTPLLLRYDAAGYNCMHQDLYGEIYFPLQLTCLLNRREIDFTGGEFMLAEQRPRAQSRCEAITLDQGQAVIFATRWRPVKGVRRFYRVNVRHGVSTIRSGHRTTLGIIFHDAK